MLDRWLVQIHYWPQHSTIIPSLKLVKNNFCPMCPSGIILECGFVVVMSSKLYYVMSLHVVPVVYLFKSTLTHMYVCFVGHCDSNLYHNRSPTYRPWATLKGSVKRSPTRRQTLMRTSISWHDTTHKLRAQIIVPPPTLCTPYQTCSTMPGCKW